MKHVDPRELPIEPPVWSSAPRAAARGRSRRRDALRDGVRAFRRRLLGLHDSLGPRSGFRAIHDAPDLAWSFYDGDGLYCTTLRLQDRPAPELVDAVAAIFTDGYEAGRASGCRDGGARRGL